MKKLLFIFLILSSLSGFSQGLMSSTEAEGNTVIFSPQDVRSKLLGNLPVTSLKTKRLSLDTLLKITAKGVGALIVNKADLSYVNTQLAGKTSTSQVNTIVAPKMDSTRVKSLLTLKADLTALNSKVETSTFNSALSNKANTSDLALKSNTADVNALLNFKVNNSLFTDSITALRNSNNTKASILSVATNTTNIATNTANIATKASITLANQKLHTVATKTALIAFVDADKCEFDGSTWERKSGNIASNGGSFAGTIVNVSGTIYWERVFQHITPQMFGAKGDNLTDDITAFNNMTAFAKSKANPVKIVVPQGNYKLNNTWVIDGTANNKALAVEGIGNVVLNFSNNPTSTCVQFGSSNTNTLSGSFKNFKIEGTPTMDGLTLKSGVPYACAYNTFEDLHFYNVRDGVNFSSGVNTTSNFGNTFAGILKVERYFRFAVKAEGTYNNFNHLFLVQPSGETDYINPNPALGNLTLALYDTGLNNVYNTVETEDQIVLNGGYCQINNLAMERIFKGVGWNGSRVGLSINGSNVSINNLIMIQFNKNSINQMVSITGVNSALKNVKYENFDADSQFLMEYSVIPNGGSGIIQNCDAAATLYNPDFSGFENQTTNWNFINVKGQFGFFTKFSGLSKFTSSGLKLGDSNNIEPSSVFELQSTAKGILIPRMTQTQRNAIGSPAPWLQIICTDCVATDASTGVLQVFNGTVWKNTY